MTLSLSLSVLPRDAAVAAAASQSLPLGGQPTLTMVTLAGRFGRQSIAYLQALDRGHFVRQPLCALAISLIHACQRTCVHVRRTADCHNDVIMTIASCRSTPSIPTHPSNAPLQRTPMWSWQPAHFLRLDALLYVVVWMCFLWRAWSGRGCSRRGGQGQGLLQPA